MIPALLGLHDRHTSTVAVVLGWCNINGGIASSNNVWGHQLQVTGYATATDAS